MDQIIRDYMAEIGRKGGSRRTEAQKRAARENGKRGGRPKKDKKNIDKPEPL